MTMMSRKNAADPEYPKKLWAVYDGTTNKLLERYKSKVAGDKSYTRVYKSFHMADEYIKNYLDDDKDRYTIYEYTLKNKI